MRVLLFKIMEVDRSIKVRKMRYLEMEVNFFPGNLVSIKLLRLFFFKLSDTRPSTGKVARGEIYQEKKEFMIIGKVKKSREE